MLEPTSRWINTLTDSEGISMWQIHSNPMMELLVPPSPNGDPGDLAPALEFIENMLQRPPFCPTDEMLPQGVSLIQSVTYGRGQDDPNCVGYEPHPGEEIVIQYEGGLDWCVLANRAHRDGGRHWTWIVLNQKGWQVVCRMRNCVHQGFRRYKVIIMSDDIILIGYAQRRYNYF